MDKTKKNMKWIVCLVLAVFHFILMAMPVVSYVNIPDEAEWNNTIKRELSGYASLGEEFADEDFNEGLEDSFDNGGGTWLVTVPEILSIVAAVVLLAASIYMVLKAFVQPSLPDFGSLKAEKACSFAMLAYAGVQVLLFLLCVIFTLCNHEAEDGAKWGFILDDALFIGLILSVGAFVTLFLGDFTGKKAGAASAPRSKFVCTNCGTVAKRGSAFCQACGGKVQEVVPVMQAAPSYVCSNCGAPAKAGVAFCSHCGGQIVVK